MSLLHPDDLIQRLRRDNRRCFVVTGRHGEGKTHLANQMAKRYEGQYIDLLATFAADQQLSEQVDAFTPRHFKDWLQPHLDNRLLLLDEMDFLWATWQETQKEEFLNILQIWRSPAFVGVFLLPDPIIEHFNMVDQDRQPRIFSIHELLAL